jgi:DUF1680 family protein
VSFDVQEPVQEPTPASDPAKTATAAPLLPGDVTIEGGFWAERQRLNHVSSLPHGFRELERAGNLNNLRLAGGETGKYRTLGDAVGLEFQFLDSDVYKWLEAAAWDLRREPSTELLRSANEAIEIVRGAQRADGYINSYVQVLGKKQPYEDLQWGHELYTVGHLIQAAVAWHEALGDDRLLDVASAAVASIDREFGPSGRKGYDGHPEIEMALVQLFRATGDRRHLELAARMIDLRGSGLLGQGQFGSAYWQDLEPVREATSVAGHAVRQLYLDSGAVDVAMETGDRELIEAVHRRWRDMVATRMYLTGGLGSRHMDESFGDPFELPPDRAYAETCAAIASVMLAWRLLLATGDPQCADVIERTIYNGVLSGSSLDGTSFFYVNPLQRRTCRVPAEGSRGRRSPWNVCACCPPNIMRLMASWDQYLATVTKDTVQIHQYATSKIAATVGGGRARLSVETNYPWEGRVKVTVEEAPDGAWSLALRVPDWCQSASVKVGSAEPETIRAAGRWTSAAQVWQPGDEFTLSLDMPPRVTQPDPRIDAIRGSLALERGPLVYCIESDDLPPGVVLEEVVLEPTVKPSITPRPDVQASLVGLIVPAIHRPGKPAGKWPYRRNGASGNRAVEARAIEVGAIPYFAWANRSVEAMRVWIPVRS